MNIYNIMTEYNNLYNQIIIIKKNDLSIKFLEMLDSYNNDILNYYFYLIHNFIFDYDTHKEKIIRICQKKFRNELIVLYDKKCIISGVSNFEACHIEPFCDSDLDNKYNKYNGILLRSDLHSLFDKYIFSINPNTLQIEFNANFLNNEADYNVYNQYNNLKIKIISEPKLIENLTKHYNIFSKK
jgi:hypothetical protein